MLRDGKRAVELASIACELTNRSLPTHISTLAAAYAEVGDWDNAVIHQTQAAEMSSDEAWLAPRTSDPRALSIGMRPYREEPDRIQDY